MTSHPHPTPAGAAILPKGASFSYMTPEEFTEIGLRLYGLGWQTKLPRVLDRSRIQIHRYTKGTAIPQSIAVLMRLYRDTLDSGNLLPDVRPVGYVLDGVFTPLDLPVVG